MPEFTVHQASCCSLPFFDLDQIIFIGKGPDIEYLNEIFSFSVNSVTAWILNSENVGGINSKIK